MKNKTLIKKCQNCDFFGVMFMHNANVFVSEFQKRKNYIDNMRNLMYNTKRISDLERKNDS